MSLEDFKELDEALVAFCEEHNVPKKKAGYLMGLFMKFKNRDSGSYSVDVPGVIIPDVSEQSELNKEFFIPPKPKPPPTRAEEFGWTKCECGLTMDKVCMCQIKKRD